MLKIVLTYFFNFHSLNKQHLSWLPLLLIEVYHSKRVKKELIKVETNSQNKIINKVPFF